MKAPDSERAERLRQAIRLKRTSSRSRASDLSPRPADAPAHLGEMQRSLWLAHRIDPASPAYNLVSAVRARGVLDVEKLERAWGEVVSRHRLLRSTFRVERDTVLQIVHPPAPGALEVLEVAAGTGLQAALDEAKKPFELEAGPLVRLRLVEEASGRERLLLLVLHHILADERSLGLLWKELALAYEGQLAGGPGLQYDDYVHWMRQRDRKERAEALDWWRRRLDPLPEDTRLPFERAPSEASVARGRLLQRASRPKTTSGIRRLAAAAGATPFAVFAFAFRLLLQRYTGGQRTAFATPVSVRSHPATANMIGYFLNPLVVEGLVDEGRAVATAIHDFNHDLREAMTHASVSFQTLVEELSPPRQPDRHPLFQIMFVYQEASSLPELGDARLEPVALDLGASKFNLTLFVTEGEHSLELAVEYRVDRFDEHWMERLLDHYETLIERLPEALDRATAEVSMLGERELRELRADAQGAPLVPSERALLPRQIFEQAAGSPQAPAVVCGGVRQSYEELSSSARSIARELSTLGVKPGDRVGVFLDRSVLMMAGLLGTHWAGAAYVPLDPGYPEARNRRVLDDADVAAVLTTSALRARLPEGPWSTISVDDLDGDVSLTDPVEVAPESPAYLLYTSGSTGRPKGVVVTHDNLRASTMARFSAYEAPPKRFLLVPSVAFDSSVAGIFWTLAAGGTLVIPTDEEARDSRRLAQIVAQEGVTSLLLVPSLYLQMLAFGGLLQGLETAIVAGESCSSHLVNEHFRALSHVRLFNEYGPTEATVWATLHEVTERDAARPVAIGRPIPGVRVDVLDALGRPVPAGVPGHAWIVGPTVAEGYWRRPELTEERFVVSGDVGPRERRYRTGDQLKWTPDGRLLFLGREDQQIKLRGFRIEPGEVEAALLESPDIDQAAVVARSLGSGSGTAQLVAFVEVASPAVLDRWRQEVSERLPDFMVPSRLVVLAELPRLPNGKIDRARLRGWTIDAEAQARGDTLVPSAREQGLLSLWEGLLGRSGIGLDDNFFELGGHSLLVVEMTLAIERDLEVALSAADVFDNPTVRELARRISERGGPRAPAYRHLFPIQPTGRKMPFIVAAPHFFTEMFAARFRGERPVYGLRGVSLRPEGNRGRWPTMRDLGEELVAEIRRRFPDAPGYIVAGYSFGASMAVEAARILEERGVHVRRLYLIAPMPVDVYRFGPLRMQLDGLRKGVEELSLSEALHLVSRANHPLTRRPYERAWRRLAVEPWRHLLCLVGKLRSVVGLPLTPRILYADVRLERFRLHARYRPGLVHAPTVVFNAREPATDAAATWRPYFRGPFTVCETSDPHLGEASVEAARQEILRHLEGLGDD